MDYICTYLEELTETTWYRSITDGYIYTDNNSNNIQIILKNNNIKVSDNDNYRIYVKIEDVYNLYIIESRDEKINNILK